MARARSLACEPGVARYDWRPARFEIHDLRDVCDLSVAKTGATLLSGTLANVSEVVAPMIALFGGPGVPTGACV